MKLVQFGRRLYFHDVPQDRKVFSKLERAGCTYDETGWWIGSVKREKAEMLVRETNANLRETNTSPSSSSSPVDTSIDRDSHILIGRAIYNEEWYYVIYVGPTRYGQKARLCWRDGSRSFWVEEAKLESLVRYMEKRSINELTEFGLGLES